MSISEASVIADMTTSEGPGVADTSKSSEYGNAWVCKIVNSSSNRITYDSPYKSRKGAIPAGATEANNTKGYIPFTRTGMKYELSYYNTSLKAWSAVGISDPDGDWMLSFREGGVVMDMEAHPPGDGEALITLVFTDGGFSIEECGYGNIPVMTWLLKKPHL